MWNVSASRMLPEDPFAQSFRLSVDCRLCHTCSVSDIFDSVYYMCSSLAHTFNIFIVSSSIPFRWVFFFSFQTNDVVVCSLKYYLFCVFVCVYILKGKWDEPSICLALSTSLYTNNNIIQYTKYPHRKTIPSRRFFYLFYSVFSLSVVQLSCKYVCVCGALSHVIVVVNIFLSFLHFSTTLLATSYYLCVHLHNTVYQREFMNTYTQIHRHTRIKRERGLCERLENKFTKHNHDIKRRNAPIHDRETQIYCRRLLLLLLLFVVVVLLLRWYSLTLARAHL